MGRPLLENKSQLPVGALFVEQLLPSRRCNNSSGDAPLLTFVGDTHKKVEKIGDMFSEMLN